MNDAGVTGTVCHLEVLGKTDTFLETDVEDSFVVAGDSAETKTLVIDFIPVASATDSVDGVETYLAAALTVLEDFIDSATHNTVPLAVLSVAWRANTGKSDGVEG